MLCIEYRSKMIVEVIHSFIVGGELPIIVATVVVVAKGNAVLV